MVSAEMGVFIVCIVLIGLICVCGCIMVALTQGDRRGASGGGALRILRELLNQCYACCCCCCRATPLARRAPAAATARPPAASSIVITNNTTVDNDDDLEQPPPQKARPVPARPAATAPARTAPARTAPAPAPAPGQKPYTGMWGGDEGFWKYVYGCLTCVCFERLCMVCCSFCRPSRTATELPARVAQPRSEELQPLVAFPTSPQPPPPAAPTHPPPRRGVFRITSALRGPSRVPDNRTVTFAPPDLPMIGLSTAGCQVYRESR